MVRCFLRRLIRAESGQDLIEYALLAMFIALAVTASLTQLGCQLNQRYSTIGSTISGAS